MVDTFANCVIPRPRVFTKKNIKYVRCVFDQLNGRYFRKLRDTSAARFYICMLLFEDICLGRVLRLSRGIIFRLEFDA